MVKKQLRQMSKTIDEKINYRAFKMILDKSLSDKVLQYTQTNEIKITGLLRLALRDFFQAKEVKQGSKN